MDGIRTSRWVAVIATVLAIPGGIWGIRMVGRQDRLAGIAAASAAAAAHGCHLDKAAIGRMIGQVREKSTIGWTESGSDVAKSFASGCHGPTARVRAPS